MEKWKLLLSGDEEPLRNMEVDYALWKSAAGREIPPVLRFYGWNPPAVSLGYNQSSENTINTEFCKNSNIPIVRRPTGGSAIFHDRELTYSFCANCESHPLFSSPLESYFSLCRGIIKGLEKLGLKLEIRGFSAGKEPSFTQRDCFSLTTRHDLIHEGKKVVGSAQRRNKDAFLQHGSILLEIRKELWEKIFVEKVDFSKITAVNCLLSKRVLPDELIGNIKEGFEEEFGVDFSG